MVLGAPWVRAARKEQVDMGRWVTGKRMPPRAFPMRAPYRLGSAWTWRVISFVAGRAEYRILVAYRADRHEFIAMLGHLADKEMTVLCRVEHHGSHPGWHVHYQSDKIKQSNVVRSVGERRRSCGGAGSFGTNMAHGFEGWAISVASDLFRLNRVQGEDGGLL